jgi:hypothetical protein
MKIMKTSYKGFKIGQKVVSINGNVLYSNIGNLLQQAEIGTEFIISSFPVQISIDPKYSNYISIYQL